MTTSTLTSESAAAAARQLRACLRGTVVAAADEPSMPRGGSGTARSGTARP